MLFLPEEFPSVNDVTVYNGWFPELSRPLSLYSAWSTPPHGSPQAADWLTP
ncbi:hypothetical protein [Streptomyces sp. IBSNAI001]|uniref:hypothetical protein n=1 Tax=Streptomyces sp. IBSNAI001 TaxID=3457499 RepID=UPI003FD592CA